MVARYGLLMYDVVFQRRELLVRIGCQPDELFERQYADDDGV